MGPWTERAEKMNPNDESKELETQGRDYAAAGARVVASLVPYVGPALAEIVGFIIPNQRMDRIAKFVNELKRQIERIEDHLTDEESYDLLEEGFRQASHSLSDDRRAYIASLIVRGLTSDEIEVAESRHLLRILDEMSDVEVIWLRLYGEPYWQDAQAFTETHKEVLAPAVATLGGPLEVQRKSVLQGNYKEHLAQLSLLERRFRMDSQTGAPEFRPRSGAMEVEGYELTPLGRILLNEIGLGEDDGGRGRIRT